MSNIVNLKRDLMGTLIARIRLRGGSVEITRPESIAALAAAFTNDGIEQATLEVYLSALADIPPGELQAVVVHLIETQEERWFPTVATLRRMVFERRLALPSPAEAWEQIQTSEGRKAAAAPVKAALEAVGGSWALKTSESLSFFRRDFIDQYESTRRRALDEASGDSRAQLLPGRRDRELGNGGDAA